MAATAMLNTLNFSRRLKGGGFSPEQAETLADAMADEATAGLASKADLAEFATKSDLRDVEVALKGNMKRVESGLTEVELRLRKEIKELELTLTLRMGAMGVAIVTLVLAGMKLMGH